LASIRPIFHLAALRIALFGEIRSNFFLGANPEFPTPRLRAAHAPGALSSGDARPGTSKFAHHRNGHLTGVFAIYRFCLRDAAAVRNTCELMSP
jgi:hypothetical protein